MVFPFNKCVFYINGGRDWLHVNSGDELSKMDKNVNKVSISDNVCNLHEGSIPNYITHLRISNRNITRGIIPNSVTYLILNCFMPFNPNIIPDSVIFLYLDSLVCFDPFSESLPSSVKYLHFGQSFNSTIPINILPHTILYLDMGWNFNRPIIPRTLQGIKYLIFGYSFNEELGPGCIPDTVTHLRLGSCFNKKINPGDIPKSVKYLDCSSNMRYDFTRYNIPGVTSLSCSYTYNRDILDIDSITELRIGPFFNSKVRLENLVYLDIYDNIYRLDFDNLSDTMFIRSKSYKTRPNKWTINSCKYFNSFDKERGQTNTWIIQSIHDSIISYVPIELVFYMLEY